MKSEHEKREMIISLLRNSVSCADRYVFGGVQVCSDCFEDICGVTKTTINKYKYFFKLLLIVLTYFVCTFLERRHIIIRRFDLTVFSAKPALVFISRMGMIQLSTE